MWKRGYIALGANICLASLALVTILMSSSMIWMDNMKFYSFLRLERWTVFRGSCAGL